jgi:arylsulfatase A-like enzyme
MQALLIIFDRLPYSLLGCYGNTETSTPGFDRLAAGGITFDLCFAAGGSPDASMPELAEAISCLRSRDVTVHILREEGCASASWIESADANGSIHCATIPENAQPLADRVEALLPSLISDESERDAWLMIMSLRGVPAVSSSNQEAAEHSAIGEADAVLARILDQFTLTAGHRRLLLVTAISGHSAGEESDSSSARGVRDAIIHVPLLGRIRPSADEGVRCDALVTGGDVGTTLLDWFGWLQTAPEQFISLLSLIDGEHSNQRDMLVIQGADGEVGVRTSEWYLVTRWDAQLSDVDRRTDAIERARLFRKPEDLWDILDVSTQSPDVVEQLVDRIRDVMHSEES